jgi:60 kDa SS-A/Ro ribonucleoprotein
MSKALANALKAEKAAKNNTPQTVQAAPNQVKNNAGGFTFKVSDKSRLERFLILGTDGGTYYVGEQKHTSQNIEFLRKFVADDLQTFLDVVTDVSVNGRAYRNSPAIFAISLALTEAPAEDKARVREVFGLVVRTSTHLFEAAEYVDNLGGWGRAKRKAFAEWYEEKDADALAYQVVKYRQRNGWTHRDVLRLSHAVPPVNIASFVLDKPIVRTMDLRAGDNILTGFRSMQTAGSAKEVVSILGEYKNLPWETIPTQFLKDVNVWKTLFHNGQLSGQALVRNITRLARIGAFKDLNFAAEYATRLTNEEMIRKSRLHPINFLNASVVHKDGQIDRNGTFGYYYGGARRKDWETSAVILDALDSGFTTSFKTITPAGKRTMVATDISGSMGQTALGLDLSCAQVSAAMGMTIARSEPAYVIKGFSTSLIDLGITARTSLATAMKEVSNRNFGGTDCAAPMIWAEKNGMEIDTFVVLTDNETWAGRSHPFQALKSYRQKTGIDARLAVLGVAATDFTIADPSDRGMMDFCGFDSNAPRVLADFSAGRI